MFLFCMYTMACAYLLKCMKFPVHCILVLCLTVMMCATVFQKLAWLLIIINKAIKAETLLEK